VEAIDSVQLLLMQMHLHQAPNTQQSTHITGETPRPREGTISKHESEEGVGQGMSVIFIYW
jgi:hypothetical protein